VTIEKKLALGRSARKEVGWRKVHRKQKAESTLVRERERSEPDWKHGSSRKAMTLLVRGRRLVAGLNPERRVNEIGRREADAPPSQRSSPLSTTRKQTRGNKGSDAPRSASKRKASSRPCPQGNGHPRRSKLTIAHPDAAGIDVGARVHYVAVPEGRAEPSVRSFGAYTAQLEELVQWLKTCGITTVAMESTGVYRDCVVPEARSRRLGSVVGRCAASQACAGP
jgi:hypothetical protein